MQINITTDYAIRIVLFLAIKQSKITSKELSENLGIPQNYLLKISRELSKAKIIKKLVGVNGGFVLNRGTDEITLFEIINLMEPTTKLNRCLEEDEYCSRYATKSCPVRKVYIKMQDTWEEMLKGIKLKDLV